MHCTELEFVPSAVDTALQTAANVSFSSELQNGLLAVAFYGTALPSFCYYNKIGAVRDKIDYEGCVFATRVLDGRDIQVLCLYFIINIKQVKIYSWILF